MFTRQNDVKRISLSTGRPDVMELPNLLEIQFASYERFLQSERMKKGEPLEMQGLEEAFRTTFPIESPNGDMRLEYDYYILDFDSIKYTEEECKRKGLTYAVPLKAQINLIFLETGEIRQKMIYMGDIPLMTDRGTFIINGAERVVVSQIHRSPGVVFSYDKGVYGSRIIPYRGSWLEFEIDAKKDLVYAKIDRKKKILGTLFLRALGYDTREKIIECFYSVKEFPLTADTRDELLGKVLAKDVFVEEEGESKKLLKAGSKIHPHEVDELLHLGVSSVSIIDESDENSLHSDIILNCFDREEAKYTREEAGVDEPTKEDALIAVYSAIMPGDPITMESAEKDLHAMFFSERRYDLGDVGRYKLNKKFDYNPPVDSTVLIPEDIVNTMRHLIKVYTGEAAIDDIDHLGNRRIRSVGELLSGDIKTAFSRMERIARERMSLKENDTIKPQDLLSIKPITAAIKEFFGSSQLSQFMDQVNPLSELTHKRRLSALGPGGLSRERAGFEVRDVHYTHYGRMCPIETPEGPNIGLIMSLALFAKVNDYGFLEAPYRKVENGRVTDKIEYLSAMDEEKYYIAQANAPIDENGNFTTDQISVRRSGDYTTRSPEEIHYMDVSPRQVVSASASLIPFLEHDDANRALMGSNMQRQAVPLMFPEPPRVGTGMEFRAAYDSGVVVKAKRAGVVEYVSSTKVVVKPDDAADDSDRDIYFMNKYQRTNQDTCFNHRPMVKKGQKLNKGDVIADGPSTFKGELALGRNVLVAFVPWYGYNYEDAIVISERLLKYDVFTSIHIKEFSIEVRETKLGPERITRDIPNVSEKHLEHLDQEGVVRIGAKVGSGAILVGKITPKSDTDLTPEFKLLNSIFGEKAKEVRDSSLRLPHGVEGIVIDVQRLRRSEGDELSPGVEEVVKVLIASKRKLQEGDKMAGRHGNKGVISRVLPEEDMPFLADGTPVDICLNPLGVPSRMNLGQILETELGWAAVALDEWYATPVFESASPEMIEKKLKEAGLPETSKTILYDGKTGEPFHNPVMVGQMYMLKLNHLVADKMHARSTGPYSLVTQQPLGGKAQFGGQRLGEMEVWALEAYGAANTLQELLTVKSDDMNGRTKIYESIVKGEPSTSPGIPESFNVLVQELRGLGLDLTVMDSRGKPVPLTERDEELTSKSEGNF
ncbi:DNA-directed RNA polymerase subunit beta [Spirochaetia bacterium 38H-sp]|uniref:DNA-directed RNA polymerase subunit beta n=1 Tax=Rarispira pelagica TaxID=3141764 RepID=A0ABU9UDI0_9SPIR